jgi:hypothetical protein
MMSELDLSGIDVVIEELGKLSRAKKTLGPVVAEKVIEGIERNVAAQRAPDGTPWTPGRSGQGRVLKGAAKAVSSKVSGSTVVIFVEGVEARHHLGAIKGAGSIALGAGGKRRDTGHKKGDREKLAKQTGEAFSPGRQSSYARPILPEPGDATVTEAFRDAVKQELGGLWKAAG